MTAVLFESPNRLQKTVDMIRQVFGEEHRVCIALEMTKMHEQFLSGSLKEVQLQLDTMREKGRIKGEVTVVVAASTKNKEVEQLFKESYFDSKKDLKHEVDILEAAYHLHEAVEMR